MARQRYVHKDRQSRRRDLEFAPSGPHAELREEQRASTGGGNQRMRAVPQTRRVRESRAVREAREPRGPPGAQRGPSLACATLKTIARSRVAAGWPAGERARSARGARARGRRCKQAVHDVHHVQRAGTRHSRRPPRSRTLRCQSLSPPRRRSLFSAQCSLSLESARTSNADAAASRTWRSHARIQCICSARRRFSRALTSRGRRWPQLTCASAEATLGVSSRRRRRLNVECVAAPAGLVSVAHCQLRALTALCACGVRGAEHCGPVGGVKAHAWRSLLLANNRGNSLETRRTRATTARRTRLASAAGIPPPIQTRLVQRFRCLHWPLAPLCGSRRRPVPAALRCVAAAVRPLSLRRSLEESLEELLPQERPRDAHSHRSAAVVR